MTATEDERPYTITGPNAWAVTATCTICGFATAAGYATHVRSAIDAHLARNHPPRTPVTLPDDDGLGLVLVGDCPAGHEYWALPGGAHEYVFDTWWDAHRHHEKAGKHRA